MSAVYKATVAPMTIVNVKVSSQTFNNLDRMQSVMRDVLGRLGCMACCSGFDIRFSTEVEFLLPTEGTGTLT